MLKDLVKVANKLDSIGLTKEADYLDEVITKLAQSVANDENYREVLRAVAKSINDAHQGAIRARSGREDGVLSLIIGGSTKPQYAVVAQDELSAGAYKSPAELSQALNSSLEHEKDRYQALTGIDVSAIKFQTPEKMEYDEVDKDDARPESKMSDVPYMVWVVKTNIENTFGERMKGSVGMGEEGTGMYDEWKDEVGGR